MHSPHPGLPTRLASHAGRHVAREARADLECKAAARKQGVHDTGALSSGIGGGAVCALAGKDVWKAGSEQRTCGCLLHAADEGIHARAGTLTKQKDLPWRQYLCACWCSAQCPLARCGARPRRQSRAVRLPPPAAELHKRAAGDRESARGARWGGSRLSEGHEQDAKAQEVSQKVGSRPVVRNSSPTGASPPAALETVQCHIPAPYAGRT